MSKFSEDKLQSEVDINETAFGPLAWMVRPCEWYYEEYRDCKSIRGRIHQYFISGTIDSCDTWRDDFTNCQLFRKTQNIEHLNKVIQSELDRKAKRFEQASVNDVWEYRTSPPEDWNKPLD